MEKVIIEVSGGVASLVSAPDGVEVEIRDYDNGKCVLEAIPENLIPESNDEEDIPDNVLEAYGFGKDEETGDIYQIG